MNKKTILTFIISFIFLSIHNTFIATSGRLAPKPTVIIEYPISNLETNRLILEPITPNSLSEFIAVFLNNFFEYMPFEPTMESATRNFNFLMNNQDTILAWFIKLKSTQEFIGCCWFWKINTTSASADITFFINPSYTKQGLGLEVLHALLHYGFESLGFNRIEATTHPDNYPSKRTLERAGFKQEGLKRETHYYKGAYHHRIHWGIIRQNWLTLKG